MPKKNNTKSHEKLGQGLKLTFLGSVLLLPLYGLFNVPLNIFNVDHRNLVQVSNFNQRMIDKEFINVKLFKEPLISVTFDDGRESVYTNALNLLNKNGIKTTQYLLSGTSKNQLYLSNAQVKEFSKYGHEIACHSSTHPDLTTLDQKQLIKELENCKNGFGKQYSITNFASPYGHSNEFTRSYIKKYYDSHRNTDGDITNGVSDKDVNVAQNFNQYNIVSASIRHDTTVEQLNQAVEYTIKNNGWLVLTYHQIEDTDNSTYGLDVESLDRQLKFLSNQPVKIVTMQQALNSLGK